MGEILRSELGLERTGDFEELEIDLDEEYGEDEDDEGIEEEIPDDEDLDYGGKWSQRICVFLGFLEILKEGLISVIANTNGFCIEDDEGHDGDL